MLISNPDKTFRYPLLRPPFTWSSRCAMYRTRVLGYQGIALYRATNNPSGPVTVTGPRTLYRAYPSDPVWRSGDQSDRHPSGSRHVSTEQTGRPPETGILLVSWTGILLVCHAPHETGLTPRLRLGSRLSGTVGVAQHRKRLPLGYSGSGIRTGTGNHSRPTLSLA